VVLSVVAALALFSVLYLWLGRSEESWDPEATTPSASVIASPPEVASGDQPDVPAVPAMPDGYAPDYDRLPPDETLLRSDVVVPEESAPGGTALTPLPGEGGRVALVIDDLGRSLEDVERLSRLGVPISYAVLPFEVLTPEVVADLRRRDAEILLHLPMEPGGGANPGPGALRVDMSRSELAAATRRALAAVPGAVGVNNHMGSKLSVDADAMHAVLRELTGRDLFFLDSRTSAQSAGYTVARELGLPAVERRVFLDGEATVEAVRYQFYRLLGIARQRGAAVAIGHPHPATFQVLEEEIPHAQELGYEFVPVSYLLDQQGGPL
jgi:hypothetical protein